MLVDSTAFVDLIRSYKPAVVAFEKLLNSQSSSIVTKFELIVGLKSKREIASLEKVFQKFDIKILPVTEEVSLLSESLLKKYYHSNGIGILDAVIASTAIIHNEVLATHNIKHFDFIPNLKLISPY